MLSHLLAIPFPEWLTNFDLSVDNFIQEHLRTTFGDIFFKIITTLGDGGFVWIGLAVLFMCFKKTRKIGITMGIALILGAIVGNGILKNVFQRPRPYMTPGGDLWPGIVDYPSEYSFPSGHTLSSFAASTAIFCYNKKYGAPALVLAALIALSRLYVYVHFPTDILAGTVLGILCGVAATFLWKTYLDALAVKGWNKVVKNHPIEHV